MANKELLETIRKEIVSRIDKRHLSEQAKNELVSILSFLSTLESEKPMNQDGLEEEIERWCYENVDESGFYNMVDYARHFAKWGAEHRGSKED